MLVLLAIAAVAALVAPIGDPNGGASAAETTLTITTNTIPPTTVSPPPSCPALQFVGVRGSGETEADGDGYGNTILAMRNALAQVPGLGADYINYSAVPVVRLLDLHQYGGIYVDSVSEGTFALEAFLVRFLRDCPRTYVILGGYSQGAHVVGDVVEHHLSSDQRRRIAAVAMFGDPRFNPNQPVVDIGGYDKKLSGVATALYGARVVDKGMVDRVRSYCLYGDPVCNLSTWNAAQCAPLLPGCAHYRYVTSNYTRIAADTAIKRWRQLQKQNPL